MVNVGSPEVAPGETCLGIKNSTLLDTNHAKNVDETGLDELRDLSTIPGITNFGFRNVHYCHMLYANMKMMFGKVLLSLDVSSIIYCLV